MKPVTMKIKILSFLIISYNLIYAQEVELIEFNTWKNLSQNCNWISSCLNFVSLKQDTLLIFINTMNLRYKTQPELSYMYNNDTLKIDYGPVPVIRDTVIFDTKSQKYDTVKSISMLSIPTRTGMDKSCRTLSLRFAEFHTIPGCFIYNGEQIAECPDTYLNYQLYNGDTINIINKGGFKHGVWLEFYDSGEVRTKKLYKNGQFTEGFLYDKNGKITHTLSDGCISIAMPVETDTK